jgi:hypothetical protein
LAWVKINSEKFQGSKVLYLGGAEETRSFLTSCLGGWDNGVVRVFLGVSGSSMNFPSRWGVTFISGAVSVTVLRSVELGTMDDSTTSSERCRDELVRLVFELLLDLLFLATFSWGFEDFFFTVLVVGTERARLGERVNARVIAALHNIRFTIQNLLCYGTILMGTKTIF